MLFIEPGEESRRKEKSKDKKSYCLQAIKMTLNENVLTIYSDSGAENMINYTEDNCEEAPWRTYAQIESLMVIIDDSITGIGSYSFFDLADRYDNIQTVQLSKKATYIGDNAFQNCLGLQSVLISDSILNIGNYAFSSTSLQHLTIGNNMLYIGDESFSYCLNITTVFIPDSVLTIGFFAFAFCESLQTINIPPNVQIIGEKAFWGCIVMKTITVNSNNSHFQAQNGILFDHEMETLIVCPGGSTLTHYQIPNTITTIELYAFYRCEKLISITIPYNVTTIFDFAFRHCSALQCVEYKGTTNPSTSTNIFWGCDVIKDIMVPDDYMNNTFCSKNVTKENIPSCFPSATFTFWSCFSPYERLLIIFFVYGIFYLAITLK